jgi:hypothetical protein
MKTSFAWASLSAILLITGCQKSSPPAAATDQSRVNQSETDAFTQNPQEQPTEIGPTASQADADQSDDPGMTTAHDKTVKQEKPSGDESSRAAPNEGDAEPPQ